ncbi:MAG: phosphohydrolase, partial [Comamonadaceae bacterium]|nr:phosphohydrolase [Comamonadaceae bacterium]
MHNDAHFLRAVTDMADKKEVVTGGAIYSETGIKLLEKDVRLDSRLYEQLIQHKLATPIDEQLLIRNGVDVRAIEE